MAQYHHLLITSTPCSSGRSVNNEESAPPNKQKISHIFVFIFLETLSFIHPDGPPSLPALSNDLCRCLQYRLSQCGQTLPPAAVSPTVQSASKRWMTINLTKFSQCIFSASEMIITHLLVAEILVPYGSKRYIRLIFTFFLNCILRQERCIRLADRAERCKDGDNINSTLQRRMQHFTFSHIFITMIVLMMSSEVVLMCERHQGWCVKQKLNLCQAR